MNTGARFIKPTRAFMCLRRTQQWRAFGTTPAYYEPRALPRIAQPSLWTAIVPKFLRERKPSEPGKEKSKEWNPATYFIVMAILIGSQAIRILTLRNDYDNFVRVTDAKIRKLNEVLKRLNRGEEVDVRGLLGTGNPEAEAEWKEVIEELGRSEVVTQGKRTQQKPEQKNKEEKLVEPQGPTEEPTKNEPASRGNFF